ncbi:MAG: hypothetical protein ACI8X5_004141 [Planctomycetota bacterium]|jgi:hypothetical protein
MRAKDVANGESSEARSDPQIPTLGAGSMKPQDTSYALKTVVALGFEETVGRVREAFANEGFGVLTEIDIKATM